MKKLKNVIPILILCLAMGVWLSGCAGKGAPEKTNTDQPYRYRVNIFLEDMNKAAGHYVPRKGKPPAVNPGKTATVKIPFIGTDKMPKKVSVIVTTMSR
jgi:hypothetical protein